MISAYQSNSDMLLATGIRDSIRFVVATDCALAGIAIILVATNNGSTHPDAWIVIGVCNLIVAVLWPCWRWQPFTPSVLFIFGATSANIFFVATAREFAGSAVAIFLTLAVGVYVCVAHGWFVITAYVFTQVVVASVFVTNIPEPTSMALTASVLIGYSSVNVTTCYISLFGRRAFANYASSSLESAHRDPLTQLLNRRGLMQAAQSVHTQNANAAAAHWCVAVVDLDKFKIINDHYGHHEGDKVLQSVASALRLRVAPSMTARTGGEEFVAINLLRNESPIEFGNRICEELRRVTISEKPISASVGICSLRFDPTQPTSNQLDAAIARADEAMYCAKRLGGDRVCHLP